MNKLILKHYKIPVTYLGITYYDMDISKAKAENLQRKIAMAPKSGMMVVKGNAAPIINQLLAAGKNVCGIDFVERSSNAFENHTNPKAEIIILYNVGCEVTIKYEVSGKVLRGILKYYANSDTLLIIETHMTKVELRNNYDLTPKNFVIMENKPEEDWL